MVNQRRAFVLLWLAKATLIAESGEPLVAPTAIYPRPSIIALTRYFYRPHTRPPLVSRQGVLRRDRNCCAYCNRPATTVDHIIPRSRGGASSWENLVACCHRCNNAKGSRTLAELGWHLSHAPTTPKAQHRLDEHNPHPEWAPYLTGLHAPTPEARISSVVSAGN